MVDDTVRVLSDRYVLGEEIGRGGSGRVLRAHDRRLDRPVAVKVLTDLTDTAVARFRREAATAARVQHPNVVTLHDASVDDGVPYLVMRLIEGPSLATRVSEAGPLDPEAARRLASDLLAGLQATHAAGVLHRDLTPRNVLFDPEGVALLGDFGIARGADDPTLTGANTVMGTQPFVAPERLRGHDATPASDLFAVGLTLRYAVTGSHGTPMPDEHDLAPLVASCTHEDPAGRPPSAAAAADRLDVPGRGDDLPATVAMPADPAPSRARAAGAGDTTTRMPREPSGTARDRRPVLVLAAIGALLLVAVITSAALRSGEPDAQPAGSGPATTPAPGTAGDTAPTFESDDPAGSARRMAEWLRDRATPAP